MVVNLKLFSGCVPKELPDGVILSTKDSSFGTSVEYSCPEGYHLKGPSQSICGMNGKWNTKDLPTCQSMRF